MRPVAARTWGPPDEHGVRVSYATSARLARVRRADHAVRNVATLLGERRTLVVDWLKGGGATVKARTLFARAGNARLVALEAAEYLLQHGWAELREKRQRADWDIVSLTWLHADELREALGLPRRDARQSHREALLSSPPADRRLGELYASLSSLATPTLARRAKIVTGLDAWCQAERSGSRYLFSHAALDDTHGMSTADWRWIERFIDPEAVGISRHTPALWLRGPVRMFFEHGELDLGAVPDMIGLSPATSLAATRVESTARAWLLVENRTSFEIVARTVGHRYIVLWMPGFVPDWWLDVTRHLASKLGIPALIAADPDPAGIDIALRACTAWDGRWQPWAMSAAALAASGTGKALNEHDRERLRALVATDLPPALAGLAVALLETGRKGEQEALTLVDWIDQADADAAKVAP